MDGCSPEMIREHENRITILEEKLIASNDRLTSAVLLIKDFTTEMRGSNNNIAELVTEVKLMTKEIGAVVKATDKHETDIKTIKDNMETKDTVLKLYGRIEKSDSEYKKGQDGIMAQLRKAEEELEHHKLEPAVQALEAQKAIKKWLITGFGAIILSIIITGLGILFYNK